MPVLKGNEKILVTGASGYVSAWCVKKALDHGLTVVGTVRSEEKGQYLQTLFKGQPFSYEIIKDISEITAHDQLLARGDFSGILHTASPFHYNATVPEDLLDPAINGTIGIMKSAHKSSAQSVKRIVVTSSVASVNDPLSKPPARRTEADWNEGSPKAIKEQGKDAARPHWYCASKTMAERAVWDFIKDEKPAFDASVINPSFIFGPPIHDIPSEKSINTSVAIFYKWQNGQRKESDLPGIKGAWVDVRDVAEAHVLALLKENAGGNRYITSAGEWCEGQMAEWMHQNHPESKAPQPSESSIKETLSEQNLIRFIGSKIEKDLGLKYTSWNESLKDMYDAMEEKSKSWGKESNL